MRTRSVSDIHSFSVHAPCPLSQSWFEGEEHRFVQELEVKLDNLDARDMRQLNEVYAEIKRVNSKELHFAECAECTSVGILQLFCSRSMTASNLTTAASVLREMGPHPPLGPHPLPLLSHL